MASLFHSRLKTYFFLKSFQPSGLTTRTPWTISSELYRFLFLNSFRYFSVILVLCGKLSWLPASVWAHVAIVCITSYVTSASRLRDLRRLAAISTVPVRRLESHRPGRAGFAGLLDLVCRWPEHVSGAENGAERVKNSWSGSGAVSGLLKKSRSVERH